MTHILVIDDDAAIRDSVALLLTLADFRVSTAANGREGLRCHAADKPDLVITDILMPEMEGIETVLHLRRLDPELPILAISGGWSGPHHGGDLGPLELVAKLGATAVLPKPFSYDSLMLAIAKCQSGEATAYPPTPPHACSMEHSHIDA